MFGIPVGGASGDIEILSQGSSFGSTATLIYLGSIPFTSASATVRANLGNNQIAMQRGARPTSASTSSVTSRRRGMVAF